MESWPSDSRDNLEPDHHQGKYKNKENSQIWDYPRLYHGTIGAATLLENDGHFEWATILNVTGARLKPITKSTLVFPATRCPSPSVGLATLSQRAEHGARFLRSHFPDIDVTSELIKEEIKLDAKHAQGIDFFDPYKGNLLESVYVGDAPFLAFPSGENGAELRMLFLGSLVDQKAIIKPCAVRGFNSASPILQIVSKKTERGQQARMAIRTYGSTTLLDVKIKQNKNRTTSFMELTRTASVMRRDTGNSAVVDVKLNSDVIILVSEHGGIYKIDLFNGQSPTEIRSPKEIFRESDAQDSFFRLGLVEGVNSCLSASSLSVKRVDFRVADCSHIEVFSPGTPGEIVTSIEDQKTDHDIRLSTTNEVLWLDDRFLKNPLFGFKHCRQFDKSLEMQTCFFPEPVTFLSSRKDELISVYDVSRSQGESMRINVPPYALPPVLPANLVRVGQSIIIPSNQTDSKRASVLRLSELGSIYQMDIGHSEPSILENVVYEWSSEISELENRVKQQYQTRGFLAAQELRQEDLSQAYKSLFIEDNGSEFEMKENSNLKLQPWGDGHDEILTALEATSQFHEGDRDSRSATFADPPLCRKRAQSEQTANEAFRTPWQLDISPTLGHLGVTVLSHPNLILDSLSKFKLAPNAERLDESYVMESEAHKRLAYDLCLSKDLLRHRPPTNFTDVDLGSMSQATENLSLGNKPPPVYFGFLCPSKTSTSAENDMTSDSETSGASSNDEDPCPLGVRLLLKDWVVGTDPKDYAYEDSYDTNQPTSQTPGANRKYQRPSQKPTQTPASTQIPRPPIVVPFTKYNIPMIHSSQPLPIIPQGFGSQPLPDTDGLSSQPAMPSTQILPGPFGARPVMKKKPLKQKVDGFR